MDAGFRFLLLENERVLAAVTLTAAGPALVTGGWYTLLVGPVIGVAGPRGATVLFAVLGLAALVLSLPHLFRLEQALGVRMYLRQVPILASLSRRMLDSLGNRLHDEQFPPGAVIVREGEPGDRLYMLKSGTVEVTAQ